MYLNYTTTYKKKHEVWVVSHGICIYIYIYIYIIFNSLGESLRLPTPSRISVTIRYIKQLYIHELLVI